ncbi:RICIN domain-containing protein [Thermomonospora umbrina]|uniref:Ricin-type beta-trefoil lectin protein n=1 Tax=Thermomonospora umbrina TaxID=111806 RepID=A0A3D9T7U8_9ACTN|nr:RICIN domain-containing protein [Thermomonospora umbrina]REF00755.1 ricin-type beta-trefoil lectin protein [Thermomonospora umbrina]
MSTLRSSSIGSVVRRANITVGAGVMVFAAMAAPALADPVPSPQDVGAASEGYYYVENYNSGDCVAVPNGLPDPGRQVVQWSCLPGADSKIWYFDAVGTVGDDVVYQISNHASKMCLAIGGGDTTQGKPAIQWHCGNGNEQKWVYDDAGRLKNLATYKCLAVPDGSHQDGKGLVQWSCGSGNEQKWRLY